MRESLTRADEVADRSVLDAFRILWQDLPYSGAAGGRRRAFAPAHAARSTSSSGSPAWSRRPASRPIPPRRRSCERSMPASTGPAIAARTRRHRCRAGADGARGGRRRVRHGASWRAPSRATSRASPGPSRCSTWRRSSGPISQSERNRRRLEDERRLFRMMLGRARTAGRPDRERRRTRTGRSHVAVRRRAAAWRGRRSRRSVRGAGVGAPRPPPPGVGRWPTSTRPRPGASPRSTAWSRSASIRAAGGSSATGPTRAGRCTRRIRVSYSKLSTLENCELQYVLVRRSSGSAGTVGYHAWVGKTVHKIIEDCERGDASDARSPTMAAAVDERWRPQEFPSMAVSETFRCLAKTNDAAELVRAVRRAPRDWRPSERFEFEFDGRDDRTATSTASVPTRGDRQRITDYKTGGTYGREGRRRASSSASTTWRCRSAEDLEEVGAITAVELAYLQGRLPGRRDRDARVGGRSGDREAEYQERMRARLS